MIPKKIHYCWFGGSPLPEKLQACINSWYKFLPDYEIIRWDESNFNVHSHKFSREAYEAEKYAFVSDYARFKILEEQGGIYMDTDVELLQPLTAFLHHKAFSGFEKIDQVAPGLIVGAEPDHSVIKYMRTYYEELPGYTSDADTVVTIMTDYLVSKGLKLNNSLQQIEEFVVYPSEYFAPLNFQNNKMEISVNTVSIHHYAGTWLSATARFKIKIYQILHRLLGEKYFSDLKKLK